MRRFEKLVSLSAHKYYENTKAMPIYEYRCDSCGHEFETIQKISDDPLERCPACAEDALRKKVSAAGFRLKGGGWYETDFKKSGDRRNVTGADAAGKESGASDSGGEKSATETSAKKDESAKSAAKDAGESKATKADAK